MNGCVHCNPVADGLVLYDAMKGDIGVKLTIKLYGVLIDLYCKADEKLQKACWLVIHHAVSLHCYSLSRFQAQFL
ncbi:hypothetical protein Q3G72_015589 [Acer saccharum]|nr:hypothetical protein Q3G72_015589 [Acer saccharum]